MAVLMQTRTNNACSAVTKENGPIRGQKAIGVVFISM